ncbi:hypothetical protein G6F62_013799 [Rhizopus arrhizus]|nr:hypothetical protein G6F62_013799 [Rhizopus arrhizus]
MLVWALPIWRDLEALKTAAQRMGQGDLQARARLSRAGSQRALARWQGLAGDAAPRVCGTVQVERDAGKSAALAGTLETLAFPSDWVRQVDRDEASALAGLPLARGGVFFAQGMLVQPNRLIDALLATPGGTLLPGQAARPNGHPGQCGWRARRTGRQRPAGSPAARGAAACIDG